METDFIVLKGEMDSAPLLSNNTLKYLGMIKIDPDGRFKESNSMGIHTMEKKDMVAKVEKKQLADIDKILQEYDNIFHGIGKIYDVRNNSEILGRFQMQADITPVPQRPRPVPYYLQRPLKQWLEEGVKTDIFEWLPQDEPITWLSPFVVQPKPRFCNTDPEELTSHMIRGSIDLRKQNQYMECTSINPSPTVEDFAYKFRSCKIFSKFDMTQSYHQLVLHPESSAVATFSTPWGNMRPKRLVFGAKASQDMFDETIFKIFGDIPRCMNQRDGILIGGATQEEHDQTLRTVLQRATDFGITFTKEKCEVGKNHIEFYGYKFTDEGLKPTEEKVVAVRQSGRPTSKEEVKSFLGMMGYLSKFILNYSSLTTPLREVTRKEVKFRWGKEQEKAFTNLKDSITSDGMMAYFRPGPSFFVFYIP